MSAEIPDGAVIVARAILNSSLWTMRSDDCKVALTCIALANWKDKKWFDGHREVLIKRGSFVRSLQNLATSAHVSLQVLRTSLKNLESTGFLTRKSTKQYTIISMPKYDKYQDFARYSDLDRQPGLTEDPTQKPTQGQHTPNTQSTQGQHTPNNKQEGEEGEERKEGEEGMRDLGNRSSPAGLLASAYIDQNPAIISFEKAEKLCQFYLNGGVKFEDMQAKVMNGSKGKKIWELFDPLRKIETPDPVAELMAEFKKEKK